MKTRYQVIIVVVTFIAGFGVSLYPFIADYINSVSNAKAVEFMKNQVSNISDQRLETEKQDVRRYNQSLLNSNIAFINSSDSNLLYENLLDITDSMAYIEIPKISVKLAIYHGTSDEVLEKGVGHLQNTSIPMGGEGTHTALTGHTGLPSARLFTDLDQLSKDDMFYIYVLDEKLSYKVDQIKIVEPEDTSDLVIYDNQDYTTLITCTPYGKNTHRLLVRGVRVLNDLEENNISNIKKQSFKFDDILLNIILFVRENVVPLVIIVLLLAFSVLLLNRKNKCIEKKKGTHFKKSKKGKRFK